MAKEFHFSQEVCEQLAQELVTEQAELIKHQVLVKAIKEKLWEVKKQLIEKLIKGKTFMLDGKQKTALIVEFGEYEGNLRVEVTIGMNTDDIDLPRSMTKKEKILVSDYQECLNLCGENYQYDFGRDAARDAQELKSLKNKIYLTYVCVWDVDFSNATTPFFFEESGMEVLLNGETVMLEDLITHV
jgi:hypothetical protein